MPSNKPTPPRNEPTRYSKSGIEIRTNKYGAKQFVRARSSKNGKKSLAQEPTGVRASSDTDAMSTAPFFPPSSSQEATMRGGPSPVRDNVPRGSSQEATMRGGAGPIGDNVPRGSSQEATMRGGAGPNEANVPSGPGLTIDDITPSFLQYAQQQMNWDALHPPRPTSLTVSEQERTRRLRANGLPFFPKSFARYSQAQKSHDKKKENNKQGTSRDL